MAEPQTECHAETDTSVLVERRAWVRYSCNLEGSCHPIVGVRGGMHWTAQVRDISRGGIGLILPRRFEGGTLLSIEVQSPDGRVSHTCMGRVVHVTPTTNGMWIVGCVFASELGEEDLNQLL